MSRPPNQQANEHPLERFNFFLSASGGYKLAILRLAASEMLNIACIAIRCLASFRHAIKLNIKNLNALKLDKNEDGKDTFKHRLSREHLGDNGGSYYRNKTELPNFDKIEAQFAQT